MFLVLRINKILQGGISSCTEPYIKSFENPKAAQKVLKQVQLAGKRLGKLKMPFGWCARLAKFKFVCRNKIFCGLMY